MNSHLVKYCPYGFSEFLEQVVALFLRDFQFVGDGTVFFRMLKSEAEVLQFGFYLVQSQSVGKRGINV